MIMCQVWWQSYSIMQYPLGCVRYRNRHLPSREDEDGLVFSAQDGGFRLVKRWSQSMTQSLSPTECKKRIALVSGGSEKMPFAICEDKLYIVKYHLGGRGVGGGGLKIEMDWLCSWLTCLSTTLALSFNLGKNSYSCCIKMFNSFFFVNSFSLDL